MRLLALLALAFAIAAALVLATGDGGAETCDSGASSIVATVGDDGEIEVSEPETSGCAP